MIDNQDKQTQQLDLVVTPKRRGRPAKEKALSNAERQRLYRERKKAQRNEKQESHKVPYEEVMGIAQELGERCKKEEARVKELEAELARWKRHATAAERARQVVAAELTQRNDQEIHDLRARAELAEAKCEVMEHKLAKLKARMGKESLMSEALDEIAERYLALEEKYLDLRKKTGNWPTLKV